MIDGALQALVEKIKKTQQPETITPRDLLHAFGFLRRTYYNREEIDQYLADNQLETRPDYNDVWLDTKISLCMTPEAEHDAKHYAVTNKKGDPIRRVRLLEAANKKPIQVKCSDSIEKAITLMKLHNYSQLPVVDDEEKLVGQVTWKSITLKLTSSHADNLVGSFMDGHCISVRNDEPLLSAYDKVQTNESVFVIDEEGHPIGIVTIADMSSQFVGWTSPYLLVEEIESQIRQICNDRFPLAEVQRICGDGKLKDITKALNWVPNGAEKDEAIRKIEEILNHGRKEIKSLDDLSFGQYVSLLCSKNNWDALKLGINDRDVVMHQLEAVNKIRNEVMHFAPENEEHNEENINTLKETSLFFNDILVALDNDVNK